VLDAPCQGVLTEIDTRHTDGPFWLSRLFPLKGRSVLQVRKCASQTRAYVVARSRRFSILN
jgi:hypothetical protein